MMSTSGMMSSCRGALTMPVEIGLGLRHEPEAHLRDDAEVRLREHAVEVRAEAVLVLLPGLRARQRAHAGAHELAVGQHDFHAAVRVEMVAVRVRRIAGAVIERVADDAAPARIRAVDPELEVPLADVPIEVEIADARLDERVGLRSSTSRMRFMRLRSSTTLPERTGRRAAVAEIAARRDRVERNARTRWPRGRRPEPPRPNRARRRPTRPSPRARPRAASRRPGRARTSSSLVNTHSLPTMPRKRCDRLRERLLAHAGRQHAHAGSACLARTAGAMTQV